MSLSLATSARSKARRTTTETRVKEALQRLGSSDRALLKGGDEIRPAPRSISITRDLRPIAAPRTTRDRSRSRPAATITSMSLRAAGTTGNDLLQGRHSPRPAERTSRLQAHARRSALHRQRSFRARRSRIDADDALRRPATAPCDPQIPPGQHTLVWPGPGFHSHAPEHRIARTRRIYVTEVKPTSGGDRPARRPRGLSTGRRITSRSTARRRKLHARRPTRCRSASTCSPSAFAASGRIRAEESRSKAKRTDRGVPICSCTTGERRCSRGGVARVGRSIDGAPASGDHRVNAPELRAVRYPTVGYWRAGARHSRRSPPSGGSFLPGRGLCRLITPGDHGGHVLKVLIDGGTPSATAGWRILGVSATTFAPAASGTANLIAAVGPSPRSVLHGTGIAPCSGVINLVPHPQVHAPATTEGPASPVAGDGVARRRIRFASTSAGRGRPRQSRRHAAKARDFFFQFVSRAPPQAWRAARLAQLPRQWTGKSLLQGVPGPMVVQRPDKDLPVGQFDTLFGDARAPGRLARLPRTQVRAEDHGLSPRASRAPRERSTSTAPTPARAGSGAASSTPDYDGAWFVHRARFTRRAVKPCGSPLRRAGLRSIRWCINHRDGTSSRRQFFDRRLRSFNPCRRLPPGRRHASRA